jgi:hypothetical protein
MLFNWKHGKWSNDILSQGVVLASTQACFPAPDAAFYDKDNSLNVSIEFKPPTETKRGVLTGIGQCTAYLKNCNIAYLVVSDNIGSFLINEYLADLFKKKIQGNLAVGLVSYSSSDPRSVVMECDVEPGTINRISFGKKKPGNYWAAWRDTPPDFVWKLLDVAYNIPGRTNRSKAVWESFFYKYYFPPACQKSLVDTESDIFLWDGIKKQRLFDKRKRQLVKDIKVGNITKQKAMEIVAELAIMPSKSKRDFPLNSLKKNSFNYINHLKLWDDQAYLSEKGYQLHKIGKIHGPTSNIFRDHLAKTTLLDGKHMELINDIEKYTRNKAFRSRQEVSRNLYEKFESEGFIKKNPRKKVTGNRQFLSSEFQLWRKFGIVSNDKKGSCYIKNRGFIFNWEEITRIINL